MWSEKRSEEKQLGPSDPSGILETLTSDRKNTSLAVMRPHCSPLTGGAAAAEVGFSPQIRV